MAKRDKSEAAQHDTFPGTGPLRAPSRDENRARPVEEAVDSAIERYARQAEQQRPNERGKRLIESLSWRGIEVSEEFRQYAERIASGEELPPYRGEVLAKSDPAFPWRPSPRAITAPPPPQRRGSGRALLYALSASSVLVAALIVWAAAVRIEERGARVPPVDVARSQAALRPIEPSVPPPAESPPALDVGVDPAPPTPKERTAALAITALEPHGSALPEANMSLPRPLPAAVSAPARVSAPAAPAVSAASSASPDDTTSLGQALNALLTPAVQTPAPASAIPSSKPAPAASEPVPAALGISTQPAMSAVVASHTAPAADTAPDTVVARKEPGPESPVQGSLLVETPSF